MHVLLGRFHFVEVVDLKSSRRRDVRSLILVWLGVRKGPCRRVLPRSIDHASAVSRCQLPEYQERARLSGCTRRLGARLQRVCRPAGLQAGAPGPVDGVLLQGPATAARCGTSIAYSCTQSLRAITQPNGRLQVPSRSKA